MPLIKGHSYLTHGGYVFGSVVGFVFVKQSDCEKETGHWPIFMKLGKRGEISGSAGYMLPEEVKEQHIPVPHYHHCYTLQLKGPTASVELLSSNRIRLRLDKASTR